MDPTHVRGDLLPVAGPAGERVVPRRRHTSAWREMKIGCLKRMLLVEPVVDPVPRERPEHEPRLQEPVKVGAIRDPRTD
jgi:hypothetical protein